MRQLVIVLQEQCEKYFEDIRPHAQKVYEVSLINPYLLFTHVVMHLVQHFLTVSKNYATKELEILETGLRQPLIKVDQLLKQVCNRWLDYIAVNNITSPLVK